MLSKYTVDCDICKSTIICKSLRRYKILKERPFKKCKSCIADALRRGSCKSLLNNSFESFYWIGFILADGHIEDNKRLVVTLSIEDIEHLNKLAKFLGTEVKIYKNKKYCTLAIQDFKYIGDLCKIYQIHPNKTKYPPNTEVFNTLTDEQLLSVFAGFIDGDGSIKNLHNRRDFNLRIKTHSSWINIINFLSLKFLGKERAIINNQGYSSLHCGDSRLLKDLKNKVLELNIPILLRKWNVIDVKYKGKYELAYINKQEIISLYSQGLKNKDIALKIGISQSRVYVILKKYKNENTNR